MALLTVEFRRMLARRLLLVFVLIGLVGIALAGVVTAANSHPPSASQLASARAELIQARARCVQQVSATPGELPPGMTAEEFCARSLRLESFYPNQHFDLSSSLRNVFLGTNALLVIAGLVLGASFIGAEWHAGTVTTLLTWEPRRIRVLLAKLIVALVAVFVLALAFQAILGLVLAAAAALRGTTQGTGAVWLRSVSGVAVRSAGLAALAAALGFALAAVGRNTAAAVGVAFAYVAVVERLIAGLRPHWQRWLIGDNSALFLTGRDDRIPPLDRSLAGSAAVLAFYSLLVIGVALLAFQRRDVT